MTENFPESNAPREMMPWVRAVEGRVRGAARSESRSQSQVKANSKAAASSASAAAQQVAEQQGVNETIQQGLEEVIVTASTAGGRLTISLVDPVEADGAGKSVGSLWYVIDGSNDIIAQYQWDGAAWIPVALSHQVISSLDAGKITVGLLDGVYIKAKTVQAESLLIGDFTNYLENGDFTIGGSSLIDGWTTTAGTPWNVLSGVDSAGNPRRLIEAPSSIGSEIVNDLRVAIQPGAPLRISAEHSATSFAGAVRPGIRFFAQDGSSIATTLITPTVASAPAWTPISQEIVAPAGAYFASMIFQRAANGGVHQFAAPQLRRMVAGALIVDGAIDGKTITGATIRTAASGARIELDSTNGLRGFDSGGNVKTQLTTGGLLTAVDATITGTVRSAASGARFELNSTQLRFYTPGNFLGTFTTSDDGTAAGARIGITAGTYILNIGKETLAGGGNAGVSTDSFVANDLYVRALYNDAPRKTLSYSDWTPAYGALGYAAHGTIGEVSTSFGARAYWDGALTNTTTKTLNAGTNYQVATVPAGYRPPAERIFVVECSASGSGFLSVTTAGVVNFRPLSNIVSVGASALRISLGVSWDIA